MHYHDRTTLRTIIDKMEKVLSRPNFNYESILELIVLNENINVFSNGWGRESIRVAADAVLKHGIGIPLDGDIYGAFKSLAKDVIDSLSRFIRNDEKNEATNNTFGGDWHRGGY